MLMKQLLVIFDAQQYNNQGNLPGYAPFVDKKIAL